ncbi:hypothetical protein [uncultured Methanosphaera sp.]|uniref:hypothetical protein n=1 Tax=uncultured Methanosphaera sp. TaxID=262501 RepID=UPI00259996CC|nr:hypothetical protein [uncultured Methanosphaera sp.]
MAELGYIDESTGEIIPVKALANLAGTNTGMGSDFSAFNQLANNNPLGSSVGSWWDGFSGGLKNTFLNSDGSWNLQNIGAGIQGLGSLAGAFGNLYMGNKALKFAKDQFNFQKDLANTNLNNSIKSYNTKLGDIANTRSVMETGSTGKYDNWYNDNKLTR